ncbi:hypothetical protein [Mucilaginibacter sp.]|uniref:hypothetical protein n=1 Tax=Mucilaginibacter sp. TaxID=1882438 RepID=UPI00261E2025|nr:hypothetical protein [Mucilaginibacter sp.]MDB4926260.1 hypothetical protein [Mucilaginibacter sp.]
MKPTADQQFFLGEYLREYLAYRETYAEFYDHILTALEGYPENISFYTALNNIIEEDFGGLGNIPVIEARYQQETLVEMKKRYWNYLMECLKFPSISIFIISSIIIYWFVKQAWFNFSLFFWIAIAMSLFQSILNNIRYIRLGYIVCFGYVFGNSKRSVKDTGFTWLKYSIVPLIILFAAFQHIFANDISTDWFKKAGPIVLTMIFTAYTIHAAAYYKIYRDEFKISIV